MKVKRNYQFVQFLLDFFAMFQMYLIAVCIIDAFDKMKIFNEAVIRAAGGEVAEANPEPLIIWAVLSLVVFVAALILPFVFAKRTKFNQRQFNMWVYAVYLIRILALLVVFFGLHIHISYITHNPKSLLDFSVLATIVFAIVIVKFTQIRIRAAEPQKQETKKREIVED